MIKLDDIYADVVVKVVDSSNTQDNVELPEAIDGKTKLDDTLLKHIIKWRKCRLKKHTRKTSSRGTPVRTTDNSKKGEGTVVRRTVMQSLSSTPKQRLNKKTANTSESPSTGQ